MDLAQVEERRTNLEAVNLSALGDLRPFWDDLDYDSPEGVAGQVRSTVPFVVTSFGPMAGVMAADWYDDVRPLSRGFEAQVFDPPGLDRSLRSMIGWALRPLFTDPGKQIAIEAAWGLLAAGVTQLVDYYDRETIYRNTVLDPVAKEWRRHARPDACAFCAYMAVAVNPSGDHDRMARRYHDHCHCTPIPVFEGDETPDQPKRDVWLDVVDKATADLDARRDRVGYSRLRRRDAMKLHPDLAMTTENILAGMRRIGGMR